MRFLPTFTLFSGYLAFAPLALAETHAIEIGSMNVEQCVLSRIEDAYDSGKIFSATVFFDNTDLKDCCWKPNVMVQYVFDCSLEPICRYIFSNERFGKVEKIILKVFPYPKKIPNELEFSVMRKGWLSYVKSGRTLAAKTTLFKALQVKADGIPLRFRAEKAVEVE